MTHFLDELLFENKDWYEEEHTGLTMEQKQTLFKEVREFNKYGKSIYLDGDNLKETAKKIRKLAEYATKYVNEVNHGFDSVTVNRNMKELIKYCEKFQKAANELQAGHDRLESLYEEIGVIFNRYFEIEDSTISENVAIPTDLKEAMRKLDLKKLPIVVKGKGGKVRVEGLKRKLRYEMFGFETPAFRVEGVLKHKGKNVSISESMIHSLDLAEILQHIKHG